MKAIKVVALILGGGILLLAALAICGLGLLSWSVSTFLCGNELFQEVYSPNGQYKAIVFERNCGATTGWRTYVSVVKSDARVEAQRDGVFEADGYPDWFSIKLKWEDDRHIIIEHNGKPIPDVVKTEINNIEVRYVENRAGIMPPRPFAPSELLLSASSFPEGWTGEEWRPLGPELIKGSHENNPYMIFTPPPPVQNPKAAHRVSRVDNIDEAIDYFQGEVKGIAGRYSENCAPLDVPPSDELIFRSTYSTNYFVGYAEHQYDDGSGQPYCKMLAQYDEFFILFEAPIYENGLTYQQFNDLARVIDQIMVQHLQP